MIKRFKSSGIVGLPDSDITFPDSRLILIKGANGSGKTTLLRHITNPFRTANNRSVELRDDVNSGYIEHEFSYNGTIYKTYHTIVKGKNGKYTNKSYLKKLVDGEFIDLVTDGGVNSFALKVDEELKYNKQQHAILNIGVENFGLLKLTNSERLEYVKNIQDLRNVDDIIKSVSNKVKDTKNELKYLDNDLSGHKSPDILAVEISDMETRYNTNKIQIESYKTLLAQSVDINTIHALKQDAEKYKGLATEVKTLYDLLTTKLDNWVESFDDIYTNTSVEYARITDRITSTDDKLLVLYNDIEEAKQTSDAVLQANIAELNKQLNEVVFDDELYNKYCDIDVYAIRSFLSNITNIYDNRNSEPISIHQLLFDPTKFKETYLELKNKYETNIKLWEDAKNMKESISYDDKYALLVPHKNTPHECPLYKYWEAQNSNKSAYMEACKNMDTYESELTHYKSELDDMKYSKETMDIINKISKPAFGSLQFDYTFLEDRYKITNLDGLLGSIEINNKNASIRNNIIKQIRENELKLEHNSKSGAKNISQMESTIAELNTLKDSLMKRANELRMLVKLLEPYKSYSYRTFNAPKLENELTILNNLSQEAENKANELNAKYTIQVQTQTKLKELEQEMVELNGLISVNKHMLSEYTTKHSRKYDLENSLFISDNIYSILKNKIVLRSIEDELRYVEKVTNNLLDGFLSIRFDLSEGALDIRCEREGLLRYAEDLSSGESSMLSIAMMMAMKNKIPWDIVSIDEGSAMLDEKNKDRFIYMITKYIEHIPSISQLFLVSHDTIIEDGLDIFKIRIEDGVCIY